MTEIVEKVARAICCPSGCMMPHDCQAKLVMNDARAAIRTLRDAEPTEEMLRIAQHRTERGRQNLVEAYEALLTAALGEVKQEVG